MHTKSHPQNSEIAQAVVDVCPRPRPAYLRVARDVRVTAIYWVEGVRSPQPMMGRRLSNASPTPWSPVKSR